MLSATSNSPQILTSGKRQIASRFIRPTIFLASMNITSKPIDQNIKQPDLPSYYKKYFGHKVSHVTKPSQLISAIHSQKAFKNISFENNICKKSGFRSSNDSIIIHNDIRVPKNVLKKAAMRLQGGKVSMFFEDEEDVGELIRNMRNLKALEITLKPDIGNRLTYQRSIFKGLRSLESFSLKFDWTSDVRYTNYEHVELDPDPCKKSTLSFLLLLFHETHLKKLKINLAPYFLTPNAVSYLLLAIEQANIPLWYFRTGMDSQDFVEVINGVSVQGNRVFPLKLTNSSQVIQKIDFLGFHDENYLLHKYDGQWEEGSDGSYEYSPPRLIDVPELVSKSRRVLDIITFTEGGESEESLLNIRPLLEKFVSLEGLYIKAVENILKCEKVPGEAQELSWTKNLKKVLLSIVDVEYIEYADIFTGTRNKWLYSQRNDAFTKLMKLLKGQCQNLELLNVFRSFSEYEDEGPGVARNSNQVKIPCEDLKGFQSIQELEVNADDKGLQGATQMFRSFKKLTKLRLNFCDNSRPFTFGEKQFILTKSFPLYENEDIFDGLQNLKELELVIRPNQRDREKDDCSVHWARYFANNITKLENLEVLRVLDSKQTKVELEDFIELMKGLGQLKNLKEVAIRSSIVKAGDLRENDENQVVELLASIVEQVMNMNVNLKLLGIDSFIDMELTHIFYKK